MPFGCHCHVRRTFTGSVPTIWGAGLGFTGSVPGFTVPVPTIWGSVPGFTGSVPKSFDLVPAKVKESDVLGLSTEGSVNSPYYVVQWREAALGMAILLR